MGENEDFAETILKQREVQKVMELAEKEGIALVPADIDEANAMIRKVVEWQNNHEGELTEEELENVAGGALFEITVMLVVGSIISASTILGTAGIGLLTCISLEHENK
jgi:hypothetical protein